MHEKLSAVRRMREYLLQVDDESFSLDELGRQVGYSPRHCMRLFKEATGRTIPEYRRLLRLTDAAKQLQTGDSVLKTALCGGFESHEGFTRAFRSAFGITPREYARGGRAIPLFIPYPLYDIFPPPNKGDRMNTTVCTATFVQRPARKLAFLPSKQASDYMSYCEELGCDWEGMQSSLPERMDAPALLTLPRAMVPAGFGDTASGVELPAAYAGSVPEGYLLADLPAGEYLMLQAPPYENPDDFCLAIEAVFAAWSGYDPGQFGYEWATDTAPVLNFGAEHTTGARIGVPVRKKTTK